MRNVSRLRLLFLLDLRSSPTVLSTLVLFALSKLCTPIKNKLYNCIFCNNIYFPFRMFFRKTFCFNKQMFFTLTYIFYESFVASFYYNFIFHNLLLVEVGGFAPPSRTCFSLLHTAISIVRWPTSVRLTIFFKIIPIVGCKFVNPKCM